MSLYRICAFLVLLAVSFYLHAAEIGMQHLPKLEESVWIQADENSGLISSLSTVDIGERIEQLSKLRLDLQVRKAELVELANKRRITSKDIVIAAVMPGGLLYAAVMQQRHKQVVTQLNAVINQLNEVSGLLAELRRASIGTTLVAFVH